MLRPAVFQCHGLRNPYGRTGVFKNLPARGFAPWLSGAPGRQEKISHARLLEAQLEGAHGKPVAVNVKSQLKVGRRPAGSAPTDDYGLIAHALPGP